jgi:hypothetical protein
LKNERLFLKEEESVEVARWERDLNFSQTERDEREWP